MQWQFRNTKLLSKSKEGWRQEKKKSLTEYYMKRLLKTGKTEHEVVRFNEKGILGISKDKKVRKVWSMIECIKIIHFGYILEHFDTNKIEKLALKYVLKCPEGKLKWLNLLFKGRYLCRCIYIMHFVVWFIFWETEKVEEKGEYRTFTLSTYFLLFNFACKKHVFIL